MSKPGFPFRPSLFSRTLRECRQLYVESGELIKLKHRQLLDPGAGDFVELMDDLHRGLVLKVYVSVCEADDEWSNEEQLLAEVLCHHLSGHWLEGPQLRDAMKKGSESSGRLEWRTLVRPFLRHAPIHDRLGELATLVTRLANLVARCDGRLDPREKQALKRIEAELDDCLPLDEPPPPPKPEAAEQQPLQQAIKESADLYRKLDTPGKREDRKSSRIKREPLKENKLTTDEPGVSLEDALEELEKLIGLDSIKHEVRSLTNFLKLQQKRDQAGLPETEISLHMVFTGNPGTGKTTVARIVGKIFGALGVLEKGHLIETDRSGLVAEYAGQTGPKTNKPRWTRPWVGCCSSTRLTAWSPRASEDPYGREAAQTLLKRAEDNRDQLVVDPGRLPRGDAGAAAQQPGPFITVQPARMELRSTISADGARARSSE